LPTDQQSDRLFLVLGLKVNIEVPQRKKKKSDNLWGSGLQDYFLFRAPGQKPMELYGYREREKKQSSS